MELAKLFENDDKESIGNVYFDWYNNFASIETFANYYETTIEDAEEFLKKCRHEYYS